jgi:DNA-binding MarR family transcriptional regulator
MLEAGDVLSAGEGLTSARWQVLGAIVLADRPLTVPQISRRMGLTRQGVHTTVSRLVRDGLLELSPNADHRRSPLVRMTERGATTYDSIDAKQAVDQRARARTHAPRLGDGATGARRVLRQAGSGRRGGGRREARRGLRWMRCWPS